MWWIKQKLIINKRYNLFVIYILIDPISNDPKTKSSSYLNNMNLNANDGTDVDAEEISSLSGFKKVYEEFNTFPDLKIVTEVVRNLG